MNILDCIEQAITNYIESKPQKNEKSKKEISPNLFPKGVSILASLREMKLTQEYGLFARGNIGLKRAKFLVAQLDSWKEKGLLEHEMLEKFCALYVNRKEPPNGLGNGTHLRSNLMYKLIEYFDVGSTNILEREKQPFENAIYQEAFASGEYTMTNREKEQYICHEIYKNRVTQRINHIVAHGALQGLDGGALQGLKTSKETPMLSLSGEKKEEPVKPKPG
jgi:hypothetical protein